MKWLKRSIHSLQFFDKSIASIEVFGITILLASLIFGEILAALLRECFRYNMSWLEQCLQYVVLWIGLLGASLATKYKSHITIEIISRFATKKLQRFINIFLNLFTGFVVFLLTLGAFDYLEDVRCSYLQSQGKKNYIALENIFVYFCPNAANVMQLNQIQQKEKSLGYVIELQNILQKKEISSDRIKHTARQVKDIIDTTNTMEDCQKTWIVEQWNLHWKAQWKEYWNDLLKTTTPEQRQQQANVYRPQWQTNWLQNFWFQKGKEQVEKAWETEGQVAWEEEKEDSDFDEIEFEEDWKFTFTSNQWEEEWKSLCEEDWEQFGMQECFENISQEQWLETQWNTEWKNQWNITQKVHGKKFFFKKTCPICNTPMKKEPFQFPRWYLLIVVPITFAIMTFRFFFHAIIYIIGSEGDAQQEKESDHE